MIHILFTITFILLVSLSLCPLFTYIDNDDEKKICHVIIFFTSKDDQIRTYWWTGVSHFRSNEKAAGISKCLEHIVYIWLI